MDAGCDLSDKGRGAQRKHERDWNLQSHFAVVMPFDDLMIDAIRRNSTGAPFSTIKAMVTSGEGELGAISISFPAISAERSSTSKATCGTVRTSSGTGASGSDRIHSIP